MKQNTKVISSDMAQEVVLDLLEDQVTVPLVITGGSMTPFLVHGRDIAYLSKVNRILKRGDMVFYRRDNGRYVLHRIFRVEKDTYTMLGDAQTLTEPGIRKDQVHALVIAVFRKGHMLQKGDFWWDFFEKVWIHLVPIRSVLRKIYEVVKGISRNKGET